MDSTPNPEPNMTCRDLEWESWAETVDAKVPPPEPEPSIIVDNDCHYCERCERETPRTSLNADGICYDCYTREPRESDADAAGPPTQMEQYRAAAESKWGMGGTHRR